MNRKRSLSFKFGVFLLLAVFLNIACSMLSGINRDTSQIAFDPALWKSGDGFEKSRMVLDLYRNRNSYITGRSEMQLLEQFGEPDTRKQRNGKTYWIYNLESVRGTNTRFAITINDGKGQYGIDDQKGEILVPEGF